MRKTKVTKIGNSKKLPIKLGKVSSLSFFGSLPRKTNALVLVKQLTEKNRSILANIVKQNPKFGGNPFTITLSKLPDNILIDSGLSEVKTQLQDLANILPVRFNKIKDQKKGSFFEKHLETIRSLLSEISSKKIPVYKEIEVDTVYIDNDKYKSEAERALNVIKKASTLIPDKYKKKLGPITIAIRDHGNTLSHRAKFSGVKAIAINLTKDDVVLAASALHEIFHLIEMTNENIMQAANVFLKRHRESTQQVKIKQLTDYFEKKKSDIEALNDVWVYPCNFLFDYAGRTYGDLDKGLVATELTSVSIEHLFYHHVNLLVGDHRLFDFGTQLLLGNI